MTSISWPFFIRATISRRSCPCLNILWCRDLCSSAVLGVTWSLRNERHHCMVEQLNSSAVCENLRTCGRVYCVCCYEQQRSHLGANGGTIGADEWSVGPTSSRAPAVTAKEVCHSFPRTAGGDAPTAVSNRATHC